MYKFQILKIVVNERVLRNVLLISDPISCNLKWARGAPSGDSRITLCSFYSAFKEALESTVNAKLKSSQTHLQFDRVFIYSRFLRKIKILFRLIKESAKSAIKLVIRSILWISWITPRGTVIGLIPVNLHGLNFMKFVLTKFQAS